MEPTRPGGFQWGPKNKITLQIKPKEETRKTCILQYNMNYIIRDGLTSLMLASN